MHNGFTPVNQFPTLHMVYHTVSPLPISRFFHLNVILEDTGFGIALGVEHDLRGSVPTCGHILSQESCVVVVRVCYSRQAKITDLSTHTQLCIYLVINETSGK